MPWCFRIFYPKRVFGSFQSTSVLSLLPRDANRSLETRSERVCRSSGKESIRVRGERVDSLAALLVLVDSDRWAAVVCVGFRPRRSGDGDKGECLFHSVRSPLSWQNALLDNSINDFCSPIRTRTEDFLMPSRDESRLCRRRFANYRTTEIDICRFLLFFFVEERELTCDGRVSWSSIDIFLVIVSWWLFMVISMTCHCRWFHGHAANNLRALPSEKRRTTTTIITACRLISRIETKLLLSLERRKQFSLSLSLSPSPFCFFLQATSLDNGRCHSMTPINERELLLPHHRHHYSTTTLIIIDRYWRKAMLFLALATMSSRRWPTCSGSDCREIHVFPSISRLTQ